MGNWFLLSGFTSQIIGILLNLIFFAIIVAKFQFPIPKIIFSDVLLFSRRDGRDCLMFRIGNQRQNLIIHPEIRLVLMQHKETVEGEDFMMYHDLLVSSPATIGGCNTIIHYIDKDSPMFGLTQEYLEGSFIFFCVFVCSAQLTLFLLRRIHALE